MHNVTGGRMGKPYLGCGEQWWHTTEALLKNEYDDKWKFEYREDVNKIPGTDIVYWRHQYGEAISDNPLDPRIIYDPWKDVFTIIYPKLEDDSPCE